MLFRSRFRASGPRRPRNGASPAWKNRPVRTVPLRPWSSARRVNSPARAGRTPGSEDSAAATAETVARSTGAKVVDVTQFPGGVKGTEGGYIALIDYLVNSIAAALGEKK